MPISRNMRFLPPLMALLAMAVLSMAGYAAETLYPGGYNISSGYAVSAYNITTSDTLVITRTVRNNESFSITGLYFSENIPPQLQVAAHAIAINGAGINYQYQANLTDSIVGGYDSYYWVVDDPESPATVQNTLSPGDSLSFRLKLTAMLAGQYQLPLHTTVFYGNNSGFFSTDDMYTITVSGDEIDTIPPSRITDLRAEP
ncbi:MAG: hypothetical protein AB1746_09115 [Candidatus Zixiibacteriota bacterium]